MLTTLLLYKDTGMQSSHSSELLTLIKRVETFLHLVMEKHSCQRQLGSFNFPELKQYDQTHMIYFYSSCCFSHHKQIAIQTDHIRRDLTEQEVFKYHLQHLSFLPF